MDADIQNFRQDSNPIFPLQISPKPVLTGQAPEVICEHAKTIEEYHTWHDHNDAYKVSFAWKSTKGILV